MKISNALIERMIEIYDHRGPQETKFEAMTKCAELVQSATRAEADSAAELALGMHRERYQF